jgi:arginase
VQRLGAQDAGCLTPPRYDRGDWQPGDGVFHASAIADYSQRLADRLADLFERDRLPVVLGGDCSILLGVALALRRRGRYGLAFLDGHSDFRHPGNSEDVGAAAGEDLALVTGRGQADLTDIEDLRPYVRDQDVVVVGMREDDAARDELGLLGVPVWDAPRLLAEGPAAAVAGTLDHLGQDGLDGFWVHLDVDILDDGVMPAVDSPASGGIDHDHLEALLEGLAGSRRCVGVDITIFDPDLDPDGLLAQELTDTLVAGLPRA